MRKRSTNVAVGAVILAGIGYVAGVLTAPKSGKETRQDLQAKAQRAKKETEAKLKDLHGELDVVLKAGKTKAKGFSAARKEQLDSALANAQVAKDKARELISAIHEGDAEDKDLKKAINELTQAIDHVKSFIKK